MLRKSWALVLSLWLLSSYYPVLRVTHCDIQQNADVSKLPPWNCLLDIKLTSQIQWAKNVNLVFHELKRIYMYGSFPESCTKIPGTQIVLTCLKEVKLDHWYNRYLLIILAHSSFLLVQRNKSKLWWGLIRLHRCRNETKDY
jgi:hypothetical protein